MNKEIVDGSTVYSELFNDGERMWNLLVRPNGSVSLYATQPGFHAHQIIFDTLDNLTPNETARRVIGTLAELAGLAQPVQMLLAAAGGGPQYNRRIVNEGKIDVTQTAPCDECGGSHLTGLLLTEDGYSDVNNVMRELEALNGKRVRVTIEWERDPQ
jgi:hypothetical protein